MAAYADNLDPHIVRQAWMFFLAREAFKEVKKACHFYIDAGHNQEHPSYPIFASGIVITYTRPFTDGDTLPRLPKKFEKFANAEMIKTHEALLEARNSIYAHADAFESHKLNVIVKYTATKSATQFRYSMAGTKKILRYIVIPETIKLCDVQIELATNALNPLYPKLYPHDVIRRVMQAERRQQTSFLLKYPKPRHPKKA